MYFTRVTGCGAMRRGAWIAALVLVWSGVFAMAAEAPGAAGAIAGRVVYAGERPKRELIRMNADLACAMQHRKKVYSEATLVNKEGALRNVMVYVELDRAAGAFDVPGEPVVVDQVGCVYRPHVFGVVAGQAVVVRNSDATLHNVHGLPKANNPFNFVQPVKGMESELRFDKPEQAFEIKCDVHPWMNTYCWVFEHPFFAVTGFDGTFTIPGLPAGEYEVSAWHEMFGIQTQRVTVAAEGTVEIEFSYEPKAE